MKLFSTLLVAVLALAAGVSARAEDGAWQFKITPYVWGMGMDGNITVHNFTAPVDVKFSDILEKTQIAAMLAAEARNGKWGILADGIYADLEDDANTSAGKLNVEVEQWIAQGTALYRASDGGKTTVDVGAGARFFEANTDISHGSSSESDTKGWTDPVVAARVRQQFAEHCFGVLYGDIGGFGVASDLTWQLTAGAGYSFTKTISMIIAYRYLDYDYSEDNFEYDVATSGLAIGLQFDL